MLKRFGQSLRQASVTNKARNNGPLRLLVSERAKMIEKVVAAKATIEPSGSSGAGPARCVAAGGRLTWNESEAACESLLINSELFLEPVVKHSYY